MKQQALAFFTMFSLILMLSIYYITLPKEVNTIQKHESVIQSLEEDIKEQEQNAIQSNNEIISSPDHSIEEKEEAIHQNEEIEQNTNLKEELSALLLAEKIENVIEIKEKTIYITILNKEKDDTLAHTILKLIYEKVQDQYFIELSFS